MASPLNIFTPFIAAFLSAIILVPIIIRLARSYELVDSNDERKIHREKVSSFGGIAIYLAVSIGILFALGFKNLTPIWVVVLALPMLVIGFLDDLYRLSVGFRVVSQILVGVLVYELGFNIFNFQAWALDMATTAFFVVLLINAYNFIDGINGLAGSLGLVASLAFGLVSWKNGEPGMAALAFAFGGSLTGFLLFNFRKKALIFMGDCGSTVLGFFVAIMFMSVSGTNAHASEKLSLWPFAIAITSIPVFDLLKVTTLRLLKGHSPFSADRSHIHHQFTDGYLSHRATTFSLVAWTLAMAALTYAFPTYFTWVNGLAFMVGPYLVVSFAKEKQLVRGEEKLSQMLEKERNATEGYGASKMTLRPSRAKTRNH